MLDYDVIIVGGGIAGASLGAEIAGRRRTLIVEAEDQCGYHATGRSAAFYLESYGGAEVAKLTGHRAHSSTIRRRIFRISDFFSIAAGSTFPTATGRRFPTASPRAGSSATSWRG